MHIPILIYKLHRCRVYNLFRLIIYAFCLDILLIYLHLNDLYGTYLDGNTVSMYAK